MKSWFEGLSRLEDAEGDMNEFAHHGADDDHGGLAGGGEAIPEGPTPSGLMQSDHGRHVQRLAQAGVSHFREARFAMHATPRLVLARVEAGEGGGLAGVIEPLWPAVERQEDRDGFFSQAGDGVEQVTLVFDRRIIVDPLADGRLNLGDHAIQMGDQGLNAGAHAGVGHRQPVLFLGTHDDQRLAASDPGPQFALGRGRWGPGGWVLAGAEVGDQPSVHGVRFSAYLPGGAVSLDPRRIDHAHGKAGLRQRFGHGFPINARGFQANMQGGPVVG